MVQLVPATSRLKYATLLPRTHIGQGIFRSYTDQSDRTLLHVHSSGPKKSSPSHLTLTIYRSQVNILIFLYHEIGAEHTSVSRVDSDQIPEVRSSSALTVRSIAASFIQRAAPRRCEHYTDLRYIRRGDDTAVLGKAKDLGGAKC